MPLVSLFTFFTREVWIFRAIAVGHLMSASKLKPGDLNNSERVLVHPADPLSIPSEGLSVNVGTSTTSVFPWPMSTFHETISPANADKSFIYFNDLNGSTLASGRPRHSRFYALQINLQRPSLAENLNLQGSLPRISAQAGKTFGETAQNQSS